MISIYKYIKAAFFIGLLTSTIAINGQSEVKIGNQTWTAENLNVDKFRNGDAIPEAKTNEDWLKAGEEGKPAWCYHSNDTANGKKYGKLYNWYAVIDKRGLAPAGWHVSTDAEWTQLIDHLGGKDVAGKKMKSTTSWNQNGSGTNESGFNGLPGGGRNALGTFMDIGGLGLWWGAAANDAAEVWNRALFYNVANAIRGNGNKGGGFSVRCIKD